MAAARGSLDFSEHESWRCEAVFLSGRLVLPVYDNQRRQ